MRIEVPSLEFRYGVRDIDWKHSQCTDCCCGHRLDTRLHKADVIAARAWNEAKV